MDGAERYVIIIIHPPPFTPHRETEVEMKFTLKSFIIWFGPKCQTVKVDEEEVEVDFIKFGLMLRCGWVGGGEW